MAYSSTVPVDQVPVSVNCAVSGVTFSIAPLSNLDLIERTWRDLESRADCSFFLSWTWIGCWLQAFNIRPYVLEARSGDAVVALGILVPAMVRRHGWLNVRSLFLNQCGDPERDIITIEYNGFLIDRNYGTELIRRCLEFLYSWQGETGPASNWDELVLGGVPDAYQNIIEQCGLKYSIRDIKPSSHVQLDKIRNSGLDYLDHLSSNTRYQIRRALKYYGGEAKLAVTAATDVAEACRFMEGLKVFHQELWQKRGQPGTFAFPAHTMFNARLIEHNLPRGGVEVLQVSAGDRPIGYLYNLIYRDWVGFYLSGFDYDQDTKAKPGLVSHYLCVQRYLKAGFNTYDFMAGSNRYKSSMGVDGTTLITVSVQKPRAKLLLEAGLRWCRNSVLERIEKKIP